MKPWLLLLVGMLAGCDVAGLLVSEAGPEDEAVAAAEPVAVSEADRFEGTYSYSGGDEQRDALAAAIEDLVGEMNALLRNVARERLAETNPVFAKVEITRDGESVTFSYDGREKVCKLDGSATEVVGIDGSALNCRLSMSGNKLVQRLRGKRGGRVNTFSISDSGRLTMKVRIHSKLMPKDMRYTLSFSR